MTHNQTRSSAPIQDNMMMGEDLYQNIEKFNDIAEYLEQTRSKELKEQQEKINRQNKKETERQLKRAYFQGGGGVNEPSPGKKKYKSDKAIVVQPRFKEPFYRNYDLYETEGVDGSAKHGPGSGLYQNMSKYKSVSEYLENKRKQNKDKYKSDDSWILDNGSLTKQNINAKARMKILNKIITLANNNLDNNNIDFPIDDFIGSGAILGDSGTLSDSVFIGGQLDEYLPNPDFEGKNVTELNFGRDYVDSFDTINSLQEKFDNLLDEPIMPKETDIFGLPQGISPPEDLDHLNNENSQYGTTDSGNTVYNKMWINS